MTTEIGETTATTQTVGATMLNQADKSLSRLRRELHEQAAFQLELERLGRNVKV